MKRNSHQCIVKNFIDILKQLNLDQIVRKQKQICNIIIKKLNSIKSTIYTSQYQMVNFTQNIIKYVFIPLKVGLKANKIGLQEIVTYCYLQQKYFLCQQFHLYPKNFPKQSTFSQHITQLYLTQNDQITKFNNQYTCIPLSIKEQINFCFQYSMINKIQDQKVFTIDCQQIQRIACSDSVLLEYMCVLLNNAQNGAAIFIGANQKMQIQGIKLSEYDLQQYIHKINNIRNTLISPSQQQTSQIFHVSYTKVQKWQYKTKIGQKTLTNQKFYLIKIYADTQNINKTYFAMNKNIGRNHSNYQIKISNQPHKVAYQLFDQFDKKQQKPNTYYQKIHKKYYQTLNRKIKTLNNIKYKNPKQTNITPQLTYQKAQQIQNKIDINYYGRIPVKKYSQHCILIVHVNAQYCFNKFLQFFQKDGNMYCFYQIYEKLAKLSQRKVYYFTYRRNTEELYRHADKIDKGRKKIVLMKIKQNITLCSQQLFPQAYNTLVTRFQTYFQTPFTIKHTTQNNKQIKYYFVFKNQVQSIFAFTLLQNSDIRSIFINNTKIKNSIGLCNVNNC